MKVERFAANAHNETEDFIHIQNLKQALNQNTWLKPYIDMNTDLRKKAKNFELINNDIY